MKSLSERIQRLKAPDRYNFGFRYKPTVLIKDLKEALKELRKELNKLTTYIEIRDDYIDEVMEEIMGKELLE